MLDIEQIAASSNMIVNGYAFTKGENGWVRALNLNAPDNAAVLDAEGGVLETSMDDIEIEIVRGYYRDNKEFMEATYA